MTRAEQLDEIRVRHTAATRGPWRWFGYRGQNIYLATQNRGRIYVMDFVRSGMQRAEPRFQVCAEGENAGDGRMTPVSKLDERHALVKEYSGEIVEITHPDAQAIAHAWEDVEFLLAEVGRIQTELEATRRKFTDVLDRLIAARRTDACLQHNECDHVVDGYGQVTWPAVEADLARDLAAIGRVRSLARQFIAEEESE